MLIMINLIGSVGIPEVGGNSTFDLAFQFVPILDNLIMSERRFVLGHEILQFNPVAFGKVILLHEKGEIIVERGMGSGELVGVFE